MQVDVILRRLTQSRLYAAYFGDLRPDVEMNQVKTVFETFLLKHF